MTWKDNTFSRADNPKEVQWLISYWRVVPCTSCKGDYRLESRQFDHLLKAASRQEALAKFQMYVDQKRSSGKVAGRKGYTLFLSKVDTMVEICDNTGEII